jgi:hypothetical protein
MYRVFSYRRLRILPVEIVVMFKQAEQLFFSREKRIDERKVKKVIFERCSLATVLLWAD